MKALAARAYHLRIDSSDPEKATALGLDEGPHRLGVASVRFFAGEALVRCVCPLLEPQEVDHYHRLVGGAGHQALDLLRGWIDRHRTLFRPHFSVVVMAQTMPQVTTEVAGRSDPLSAGRVR